MIQLTRENLEILPKKEQGLVESLLDELNYINKCSNFQKLDLYWEDEHTEYSPERVDPCPDFYGLYFFRSSITGDSIGVDMTADELDSAICLLYDFINK